MEKHNRENTVNRPSLIALGGLVGFLATSCAEQPEVQCFAALSAYSPFTVSLTKVSGDCAEEPTGMFVGAQTYVKNPTNPGDGINSIALQASEAGEWIARGKLNDPQVLPNPADKPYALGKFTSKHPNGQDICSVPTLSTAQVRMPAVPELSMPDGDDEDMDPDVVAAQDAVNASYKWSNVQVYVTAANTGTHWAGDLEYTKNGCTAKYKALAINTWTYCGNDDGAPDDSLCADASELYGDFRPLKCDPGILHCVLTGDFPALK
jgi:hypothetical protein